MNVSSKKEMIHQFMWTKIISFLELTFLDHFFFTQIGGQIHVSSKTELVHQFMLTKMIQEF